MRLTADWDVCIGSGNCVLTDPDTFDQDEDGTVVVLRDDLERLSGPEREAVEAAVGRCPSGALRLADLTGDGSSPVTT